MRTLSFGLRVRVFGFRVQGPGFRVCGTRIFAWGVVSMIWVFGFSVESLKLSGFKVCG